MEKQDFFFIGTGTPVPMNLIIWIFGNFLCQIACFFRQCILEICNCLSLKIKLIQVVMTLIYQQLNMSPRNHKYFI